MFATTEAPKPLPIETHIIVLCQGLSAIHRANSRDHIEVATRLGFPQETDFPKIFLLIRDFERVAFTDGRTRNRSRCAISAQRLIVVDILVFPANDWNIGIRTSRAVKGTRWGEGIRGMRPPPCATVNVIVYEGIYHRTPCGGQEEPIPGMIWVDMRKRL